MEVQAKSRLLRNLKHLEQHANSPLSVLDHFPSPEGAVSPEFTHASDWQASDFRSARSAALFAQSQEAYAAAGCNLTASFGTPSKGPQPGLPRVALVACPSPTRVKSRAKIRRLQAFSRSSSLSDDKVLLQTKFKRTPSLASPELFRFMDHFTLEGTVGQSEYSEVFRARHRNTDELYAVKRSTHRFASKAHRDRCLHEMAVVASLPEHPHIVSHYRAWQQAAHFYIQMELCNGGSLANMLHRAGGRLEEAKVWQVFADIAEGLEFLHQHEVVHLDIKPDNIYLQDGRCKVGDFGLAIKEHQWDWEEGDGDYLAPELLTEADPTSAADVFSLGATIYECASGERWSSSRDETVSLLGCSEKLQGLVRQMLSTQPSLRPTAEEVVRICSHVRLPPVIQDLSRTASLCHGVAPAPAVGRAQRHTPGVGRRHRAASVPFTGLPVLSMDNNPGTPGMQPHRQPLTPTELTARATVSSPAAMQTSDDDGVCSTPTCCPPVMTETPPFFARHTGACDEDRSPADSSANTWGPSESRPGSAYCGQSNASSRPCSALTTRPSLRTHWSRTGFEFGHAATQSPALQGPKGAARNATSHMSPAVISNHGHEMRLPNTRQEGTPIGTPSTTGNPDTGQKGTPTGWHMHGSTPFPAMHSPFEDVANQATTMEANSGHLVHCGDAVPSNMSDDSTEESSEGLYSSMSADLSLEELKATVRLLSMSCSSELVG